MTSRASRHRAYSPRSTPIHLLAAGLLGWIVFSALPATASVPSRPAGPSASDQASVTQTLKCSVLEVRADGALKLRDLDTEHEGWIRVTEKTKIRAKNKRAFDGRKKLDFEDLSPGQVVKVTTLTQTGELVRLKVLEGS
ncbi:MAG: hypothetical protein MI919_00280 [Holophagales bacterium]|nr:hypothetical protein [Holophagales bacterium]